MSDDQELPARPDRADRSPAARARRIGGRRRSPGAEPDQPDRTDPAATPETAPEASGASPETPGATLETPAAAPGEPGAPGPPHREPHPRRAWLLALVLAIVGLGLAGWGVYRSHGVWWQRSATSVADQRGPVLAAAKSCMAAMNTYDYRKLDAAEAKGLACTTGRLTDQYRTAFETVVEKHAGTLHATQTAQINQAGIESVSADGKQWVVLVFGQLSTTNKRTGTENPTLTPFSARVSLQRAGGTWLVAEYRYAPPRGS